MNSQNYQQNVTNYISQNSNYNLHQFHGAALININFLFEKYGVPKTVVEIGVGKGHFTFNITHKIVPVLSSFKYYAIDPFKPSYELPQDFVEDCYKDFTKNLEICPYKQNIEFIQKKSKDALYDLYNKGVKADLIYIDGDHRSPEVLQDLILSWNILNIDGVMLCDDASCHYFVNDKNERMTNFSPKLAIDSFVNCYWDRIDPLQLIDNWQYAFIKKKE